MLNASGLDFRSRHSTTLRCTNFTDRMILKIMNSMSTAATFLDVERALDPTRHLRLLNKR